MPANWVAAAGLVIFIAVWTLHGAVAGANKSLHFDLLEAYAWGKEFQLGYNQHGPFWAWIAGAWFLVFPKTNASFVLLEALNAALGLLGAWRLIGLFGKGYTRHAAALMLAATPFYTFLAFKYNANTIFVSLWPWTLFFFVRSLDRMNIRDAALFGVFAAACVLSKYYAAILLFTCAISLFFHPNGRKYAVSPLPWLAAAVFIVLVLPHVIWALTNGAPPVAYAMGLTGHGWLFALQSASRFVFDIAINLAGVPATIFLAWRMSKMGTINEPVERLPQSRRRFLAVLVVAPPLLTIVFGLGFQLRILAIMAIGIFPLLPLYLMQFAAPLDGRRCFRLAGALAAGVAVAAVAAAPLEAARSKRRALAPHRELATAVTELWHAETHTPLRYAGGKADYATGISFYSEDHPSSFIDLSYAKSLWVTPAKIKQHGLLIACLHEDSACIGKATGLLSGDWKQTSIKIGRAIGTRQAPEVEFDIFIMPPQPA